MGKSIAYIELVCGIGILICLLLIIIMDILNPDSAFIEVNYFYAIVGILGASILVYYRYKDIKSNNINK